METIITTKKGASVTLVEESGKVFAYVGDRNLGAVEEATNAEYKYHLVAGGNGGVAIVMDEKNANVAKEFMRNARFSAMSDEQKAEAQQMIDSVRKSQAAHDEYMKDHNAVIKMSKMGE